MGDAILQLKCRMLKFPLSDALELLAESFLANGPATTTSGNKCQTVGEVDAET
jgi:hypothetical protein